MSGHGGRRKPAAEVSRERFDAVLFDRDDVLTDTASIHAVYAGTVPWVRHLREAGLRMAIVSAAGADVVAGDVVEILP